MVIFVNTHALTDTQTHTLTFLSERVHPHQQKAKTKRASNFHFFISISPSNLFSVYSCLHSIEALIGRTQ